jgi:hypothetical protein
VGARIFTSPRRPGGSGVHSTSYTMGTGNTFPGVKRSGRGADHSPPASAEVKKMWIYTSTPHMPSWCSAYLVKCRDNFTLENCLIFSYFFLSETLCRREVLASRTPDTVAFQ